MAGCNALFATSDVIMAAGTLQQKRGDKGAQGARTAMQSRMSRPPQSQPRTLAGAVVLVEDDVDIGGLVEHHLRKAGFATRWFRTATNVIRETENQPPVIFLLDLMLPGIDGFELCRSIRKHEHLQGLPIIILTARTGAADRRLAIETGANDYITKPFSPADLIMRVRALCQHGSEGDAES
jgi:DNA-binding response OmpR family regulator